RPSGLSAFMVAKLRSRCLSTSLFPKATVLHCLLKPSALQTTVVISEFGSEFGSEVGEIGCRSQMESADEAGCGERPAAIRQVAHIP
ncbi:hypothetical protein, partial [Nitrobacter winogradskyi]